MSVKTKNKNSLRQIAGGVFVLFALLVSAVSACACSHHQPAAAKDANSCHGTSHDAPMPDLEIANDSFDADCSCFVKTPVPAISAKSETEKYKLAKQFANSNEQTFEIKTSFVVATTAKLPHLQSSAKYSRLLLRSGPSRAPPRL